MASAPAAEAATPSGRPGGAETVGLDFTDLPSHNHLVNAVGKTLGNQANAGNALPATVKPGTLGEPVYIYAPANGGTVQLAKRQPLEARQRGTAQQHAAVSRLELLHRP